MVDMLPSQFTVPAENISKDGLTRAMKALKNAHRRTIDEMFANGCTASEFKAQSAEFARQEEEAEEQLRTAMAGAPTTLPEDTRASRGEGGITRDGFRKMKAAHEQRLDEMLANNVDMLTIASQASSFARKERRAEEILKAKMPKEREEELKIMKEQHKQTLDMMVRHHELVNEHALASQAAAFAREEEILKAKTPKEMEEEIKTMKEQHKQTLDMMIRTNVNEHALASQAAAFARKESEVENQLAAKMSANTLAVRLQPHGGPSRSCMCIIF